MKWLAGMGLVRLGKVLVRLGKEWVRLWGGVV